MLLSFVSSVLRNEEQKERQPEIIHRDAADVP